VFTTIRRNDIRVDPRTVLVPKILRPDSCISVFSWPKVPLLSIWSVAVPLCRLLLPCPSRWHGSIPQHWLWWLICELSALPCPGDSGLCTSCWRIHFFLVLLDHQTKLPAYLHNVWAEAVLSRHMIDQLIYRVPWKTCKYSFTAWGVWGDQQRPRFILGPLHISETNRARNLKFGTLVSIYEY